jgi:hypothetical protein
MVGDDPAKGLSVSFRDVREPQFDAITAHVPIGIGYCGGYHLTGAVHGLVLRGLDEHAEVTL